MKTAKAFTLRQCEARYSQLRQRLARTRWISQRYVQNRGPGAGGPCYQWTRKVKGKTVSVALSQDQFEWLAQLLPSGVSYRSFSRKCKD